MFLSRLRLLSIVVAVFSLFTSNITAQVQTPRYNVSMTANSNGFYEYLPTGYSTPGNQSIYPVLIFLHGIGELGDGSISQLSKVLANGPPKLINQGSFPESFTVNGQTHRFIVISPQFINWPNPLDINNIIDYAIQNYRVDVNRIYLTGLSMGGGVVWDYAGNNSIYANRLAAIIPVCGASWPDLTRARTIAASNLPVWATHNLNDGTVPVAYTNDYITNISQAPIPPLVTPKKSIFNVTGHNAWTTTYNPSWKENGIYNVYEWLLSYQRGFIILPVILSSYTATITAAGIATIAWTTTQEQNNSHFTVERSTDGITFSSIAQIQASNSTTGSNYNYIDNSPGQGVIFYRLSQTDINGRTTYYDTKRVTIESQGASAISFYPNPVMNSANLELNFSYSGKLTISIYQTNGKMVKQIHINKTSAFIRQQLNLEGIAAGFYNLELRGVNLLKTIPFVKQ